MKDYLEPLLQTQEEETDSADWSELGQLTGRNRHRSAERAAQVELRPARARAAFAQGMQRVSVEPGEGSKRENRVAPDGEGPGGMFLGPPEEFPVGGRLGRTAGSTPTPGQRRTDGAAWLYGQLRQSLARTDRPGQTAGQSIPLEREERAASGRGLSLEQVDRLFQRDARRYDGEFTFY